MQEYELKLGIIRAETFLRRLERDLYREMEPLEVEIAFMGKSCIPFEKRHSLCWNKLEKDVLWGGPWDNAWFHFRGNLRPPPDRCSNVCLINTGGESLVYSSEGKAICGLTNYAWFKKDFVKEKFFPDEGCTRDGRLELWVAVTANALAGVNRERDPGLNDSGKLHYDAAKMTRAEIGWQNDSVYELIHDGRILLSLLEQLEPENYRRKQIVAAMIKAVTIYSDDYRNADAARAELIGQLSLPAARSAMNVYALGNTHIDTAWMWTVEESIKKCARTFSSQLELMELDSDYIFGASQAQHYAWMKAYYPELYQRIGQRVAEGRWELHGGMWVEADCNIPDGESLIRQFLYGKNFFMDEFRVEVKNLWLPDVFGYAASLPQIVSKCRCDSFLTTKLTWNDSNVFPYSSFRWRGIDGSEVAVHIPPEGTYSSLLQPKTLYAAQNRYSEGDVFPEFLTLFGLGDGGGGPNFDDLAAAKRIRNLEGLPRLHYRRASDFFERLNSVKSELPVWVGELYLEFHRGTLTSQGWLKRANRKNEQLLGCVEFLYSCLLPEEYPGTELRRLWELLLLNQFHDILPGTSIAEVNKITKSQHEDIYASCSALLADGAKKILREDAAGLTLMNSLSCEYRGWVMLPDRFYPNGNCYCGLDQRNYAWVEIPQFSFITLKNNGEFPPEPLQTESIVVLENSLIRYTLNANLRLVSAYDKDLDRELIPEGKQGNLLSLYRDYPDRYEAWEIDRNYEKELLENAVNHKGLLRIRHDGMEEASALLSVGESEILQTARLARDSRRLDFITEVQWREKRKMLRVSFPADYESPEASFDIPYGYCKRSTHRSDSVDAAKFEVMLHRYMDFSDAEYGTALLNDCKYGGKVFEKTLDLALLRAPLYPDPETDRCKHRFTYSFLPHKNALPKSDVMDQAAMLNRAPCFFQGYSGTPKSLFALESGGIVIGAIKKAEKNNDLIIRLVETKGDCSTGVFSFREEFESICEADMMEWSDNKTMNMEENSLKLRMTPFEIMTIRLKRKTSLQNRDDIR